MSAAVPAAKIELREHVVTIVASFFAVALEMVLKPEFWCSGVVDVPDR